MSLDEVIAMYEKEQKSRPPYPATKADERRAIVCETSYFTEMYGGSFQDTLYRKMEQNIPLSAQEERDADEWTYWLKRLERLG